MSEVPTLAEELERKCVTELERVMHGLQTRRVTIVQAAASLQTMWDTVAGLVSNDTMDLISQSATTVQKALNAKDRPDETAVLVDNGNVAIVKRYLDRVVVSVGSASNGVPHNNRTLNAPPWEAGEASWCFDRFKGVVENLGKTMSRLL